MKKTLRFTYDPLTLMRLTMDMFAEELEGKHTKAIQFARYEYLRTMTNDELIALLERYMKEQNLDAITLKDWRKDCGCLFQYIYESDRYKTLEFKFNKQGYGYTGMGVVDTSDNTFYHCGFTQHWPTIMGIIETKYPDLHQALNAMYLHDTLDEYDGVSRKELDDFITNRFELIGGYKPIHDYM
ncbi:hypothetical protein JUJ52_02895 [Virgibacillus sp. AGTR]|uniref:hypothetical protein n=1 Tax=Virgibacillus sp. AGTR TaxID=2812055 RepID=UPI001D16DD10|nr:hypothetical protein [Virgibacillus sp. AGTR]MCC2248904.1 hypothetical protein [Virgibacillus sp. AGTR]